MVPERRRYERPSISPMPDTPLERRLGVLMLLESGQRLTSQEVAEATGVTVRSAQRMLVELSRVAPIWRGEDGGWEMVER